MLHSIGYVLDHRLYFYSTCRDDGTLKMCMEHSPRKSRSCSTCRAQRLTANKTLASAQLCFIGPNFPAFVSNFIVNGSRTALQILPDTIERCLGCVICVPAERRHLLAQPCFEAPTLPKADMLTLAHLQLLGWGRAETQPRLTSKLQPHLILALFFRPPQSLCRPIN